MSQDVRKFSKNGRHMSKTLLSAQRGFSLSKSGIKSLLAKIERMDSLMDYLFICGGGD